VVVDSEVRIQDNTAISDGISDGLVLDGAVTGTVVDNVIQGNDQWGISCLSAAVTITSCSNLMGGNGAGDIKQDGGCSLSCVIQ
jgi:hypothetical protein